MCIGTRGGRVDLTPYTVSHNPVPSARPRLRVVGSQASSELCRTVSRFATFPEAEAYSASSIEVQLY